MTGIKMGVVADDITGANDIGIMFAKWNYETHVYSVNEHGAFGFSPDQPPPDVCILDTNSRLDPQDVAYRKVYEATRLLKQAGCSRYHNKTCSVFRGNIGAEFDAMLDALGQEFAVVVAGYPKNERCTIDGVHYVRGKRLAESEFREDPVHPMRESNLVRILQGQTRRRVSLVGYPIVRSGPTILRETLLMARAHSNYVILDVPDQAALAMIAAAVHDFPVICGSAAIAEELPPIWGSGSGHAAVMPEPSRAGVLCAAGSLMPQTRAQVEHLRVAGVPVYELKTRELFEPPRNKPVEETAEKATRELSHGRDTVVHVSLEREQVDATLRAGNEAGCERMEIARIVAESLAEVVARVLESTGANRLIVAGGETSGAVARRLKIQGLRIYREIQPGLPSCVSLSMPPRWLVLKSGSFGTPDFLELALKHLREP